MPVSLLLLATAWSKPRHFKGKTLTGHLPCKAAALLLFKELNFLTAHHVLSSPLHYAGRKLYLLQQWRSRRRQRRRQLPPLAQRQVHTVDIARQCFVWPAFSKLENCFLTMRITPQTGPITARDIEELVLRLHEIQVRCGGGLFNTNFLMPNVSVGYYTLLQPEHAQCSQQVKVLRRRQSSLASSRSKAGSCRPSTSTCA